MFGLEEIELGWYLLGVASALFALAFWTALRPHARRYRARRARIRRVLERLSRDDVGDA